MIVQDVRALVEDAYALGTVHGLEPLSGGYWSDVFRLEADAGTFVVRIAPEEAEMGGVAWQHALLGFATSTGSATGAGTSMSSSATSRATLPRQCGGAAGSPRGARRASRVGRQEPRRPS